nr:hypothetical protein [Rubricella aquisinus]
MSRGWELIPTDPGIEAWVASVRPVAVQILSDPTQQSRWLRHGETWFAGVNILQNDAHGRLNGVPLTGKAVTTATDLYGPVSWDRGQLSVTYPGYPKQDAGESDAAHRFRRSRDATHLDGLLPEGPNRRRHLREYHAFILGLPLDEVTHGNSPLTVYEGSHEVMRRALRTAFHATPPDRWGDIDLTDVYTTTRRRVFSDCSRVEITVTPGQAILMHRLSLHGVAPWRDSPAPRRAIAYFRPEGQLDPQSWLEAP